MGIAREACGDGGAIEDGEGTVADVAVDRGEIGAVGSERIVAVVPSEGGGGDAVGPWCQKEARELVGVPCMGWCGAQHGMPKIVGSTEGERGDSGAEIGSDGETEAVGMEGDEGQGNLRTPKGVCTRGGETRT